MMQFKIKLLFGYYLLLINLQSIRGLLKESPKCHVRINGQLSQKAIGDIWNSSSELCTKHTCEIDASGRPAEKTFREYCIQTCQNEFQLMPRKNQCCGECVATKCSFNNKLYNIGELWKSDDNCTFFECSESIKGSSGDYVTSAQINKYSKACPPLGECPSNRITTKNCCQTCQLEPKLENKNSKTVFTYPGDQNNITFSSDTYLKHPCRRKCRQGQPALTCNYKFIVEWYETLGKACMNCPFNSADCHQTQCIYADGVKRNLLVVNRMMPGPALEVCLDDTIIVEVENNLVGEGTTIHWHGIHQKETPYFDGVLQVTQCAIPSHTSFQYKFKADSPGTHWWHSHVGTQRADGAFGALIVRNAVDNIPKESNLYDYDLSEHVILMHDWSHHIGASHFNSQHSMQSNKPRSILINGKGRLFGAIVDDPSSKQSNQTLSSIGNNQAAATAVTGAPKNISSDASDKFLPPADPISQLPIEIPPDFGGVSSPLTDDQSQTFVQNTEGVRRRKRSIPFLTPPLITSSLLSLPPITANNNFTMYEVFNIKPGFKYRFRAINAGFQNCPFELSVDNHNIIVIASDGHYFEPIVVDSFVSYAGERFDFVLHANQSIGNYWIRLRGILDCDERFNKVHQGAILRYRGASETHPIDTLSYDFRRFGVQLNGLNLFAVPEEVKNYEHFTITDLKSTEPDNPELIKDNADYKFFVYFDYFGRKSANVTETSTRFNGPQLNHISMKMTAEPLLIARNRNDETKFCNSSSLAQHNFNCRNEYCECTHIINVPLNATVELILIDEGHPLAPAPANHPFHLHGYDFRVVGMERLQTTGITVDEIQKLDDAGQIRRHLLNAPIKDTVGVPSGGYVIVRFLANNPGFWLLHCHIEFRVETNMALVFKIGDYKQMRPLPKNFPTCNNFKLDVESKRIGGKSRGSRVIEKRSWIGAIAISTIVLFRFYSH